MAGFQTAEDRIEYLSKQTIPAALESLSSKHQKLTQVVQYLEGGYLSATGDKHGIEQEANNYLLNALASVAGDIEAAASNLDQLLNLNMNAVDSLTNQVQLIQTRLKMSKEAVAKQNLIDSRSSYRPDVGEAVKVTMADVNPDDHINVSYSRMNLSKRLAQLDDIGVCVNKSSTYRTITTSHFGTERGAGSAKGITFSTRGVAGGEDAADLLSPSSMPGAGSHQSGTAPRAEGPLGRTTGTGKAGTARASLLATAGAGGGAVVKPPSL